MGLLVAEALEGLRLVGERCLRTNRPTSAALVFLAILLQRLSAVEFRRVMMSAVWDEPDTLGPNAPDDHMGRLHGIFSYCAAKTEWVQARGYRVVAT
jgi:hypothetical protein